MIEVVVTTGADEQNSSQIVTTNKPGRVPFLSPNQQCQITKALKCADPVTYKIYYYYFNYNDNYYYFGFSTATENLSLDAKRKSDNNKNCIKE